MNKEYDRWNKIDYFVVPLFVIWCILFITMTPLETSFQGHSIFDIQNQTIYETVVEHETHTIYETIVEQETVIETVWGNKTVPGSE